jgi:hypothetical protein
MLSRSFASRAIVVALAVVGLGSAFACGTDPVGVESCRQIERARCENAPSCGIALDHPVHRGDSPEDDVRACIRYYDDACLHGLVTDTDPGAVATQACVDAINAGDCAVVKNPETTSACSFLTPPNATPADASTAD